AVSAHEEMDVVRLDREVNDTEIETRGGGKRTVQHRIEPWAPERRQTRHAPHRDVDGMAPFVLWPPLMRDTWRRPRWLASSAGATPTPTVEGERERRRNVRYLIGQILLERPGNVKAGTADRAKTARREGRVRLAVARKVDEPALCEFYPTRRVTTAVA